METIKDILQDIYRFDPSLKKRETELLKIINELIAAKPAAELDAEFSAALKKRLLREAKELGWQKNDMKKNITTFNLIGFSRLLAGAAVLLLVLSASLRLLPAAPSGKVSLNGQKGQAPHNQISRLGEKAFGSLSGSAGLKTENSAISAAAPAQLGRSESMSSVAPSGIGGGGAAAAPAADAKMMPPFYQQSIRFVYQGDELKTDAKTLDVYRRQAVAADASGAISALVGLRSGVIDFSKFHDLALDSFNLKEDREFGYYISYMPSNNYFSISKNWEKWPNPWAACQEGDCYQKNRVKIEDVPADEELVSIANRFLADYGVDVSSYGQPVVERNWRVSYEAAADKQTAYIPDDLTVVYPLLINGLEVYNESGDRYGLTVSVDVRTKRGSGANGQLPSIFQASSYEAITDAAEIKKAAEAGGRNAGYYYSEASGSQQDVVLGSPKLALIYMWNYSSGKGEELFVPAYIFPVKERPANSYFYASNIVVPAVAGLIENYPTPLLRDAGPAEAVSSPAPLAK